MSKLHRQMLWCWLGLLGLGVIEFSAGLSHVTLAPRLLLLLPALSMVTLVGIVFMRVGQGLPIIRCFAVGGLLWLWLLLGLASMDLLTRTEYITHA